MSCAVRHGWGMAATQLAIYHPPSDQRVTGRHFQADTCVGTTMSRLLFVTLLASASSQTTTTTTNLPGVGGRLHGKKPAGSGTSLRAQQMREVLSWHCGSATSQLHIEDKPCQNFRYMQESGFEAGLRAAMAIDSAARLASMKAQGAPPSTPERDEA